MAEKEPPKRQQPSRKAPYAVGSSHRSDVTQARNRALSYRPYSKAIARECLQIDARKKEGKKTDMRVKNTNTYPPSVAVTKGSPTLN